MRGRIKKQIKNKYKRRVRDIVIDGLGRPVVVYKQPIKNECYNCFYDKLTDKSTNECKWTPAEAIQKQNDYEASGGIGIRYKFFAVGRCPICKGKGYLETCRRALVKCKITWDPSVRGYENATVYTAAGTEGSTIVELKTNPKYYDLFKDSSQVVVDGVECKITRAPILRGLGNQALMIITVFTTEKPKINSGEIVKNYV